MLLSFTSLALVGLLSTPQGAPPVEVSAVVAGESSTIQRIEDVIKLGIQDESFVGLSVGVAQGGKLIYSAGFGMAELEHGVPANGETLFRIGSITKQFTGAAICRLAEQDKLFFDDLLQDFVPKFDSHGKEISLRHLLTHTSGIFNYTSLGPVWSSNIALDLSRKRMIKYVSGRPLEFEPGNSFNYSNSGYFLLGMVIEKASGMSYAKYIEQEFQKPLGLTRTRYGSNTDVIANRAQGYAYLGDGKFNNDDLISLTQPFSAGSMLASAPDLVRWTLALMGGKAVSEESLDEMTLPFILNNGEESLYGFGLGLREFEGMTCISHSGGINGFNSLMTYLPDSQLCVAVISNSEEFSAQRLASKIVRELSK